MAPPTKSARLFTNRKVEFELNITLAQSYKYSSLSEVNIHGRPDSKGKLLVKTDNVQGISTVVDIKLTHCAMARKQNGGYNASISVQKR